MSLPSITYLSQNKKSKFSLLILPKQPISAQKRGTSKAEVLLNWNKDNNNYLHISRFPLICIWMCETGNLVSQVRRTMLLTFSKNILLHSSYPTQKLKSNKVKEIVWILQFKNILNWFLNSFSWYSTGIEIKKELYSFGYAKHIASTVHLL